MHRMGLIKRYDKNQRELKPYERSAVKYVGLSKQGKKLISDERSELEKYLIYSKAINELLGGHINTLLTLFYEYGIRHITIYEYMFFVSAININIDTNFTLSLQEAVEIIKKYRVLSRGQTKSVIDILSEQLQPKNYKGDKTKKRDFHNWKNEAQQVLFIAKTDRLF